MTNVAGARIREPEVEQFLAFLQKNPFNMLLLGLAVASGVMLLWPALLRLWRRGNEVGTFEAVQLINRRDALVLDVRDGGDFAAGHIPNSKHIPETQVAERIKELEKYRSRPIIVSCRSGARAGGVVAVLRKHGFADVFVLRGGLAAWQQASMPLEKG